MIEILIFPVLVLARQMPEPSTEGGTFTLPVEVIISNSFGERRVALMLPVVVSRFKKRASQSFKVTLPVEARASMLRVSTESRRVIFPVVA